MVLRPGCDLCTTIAAQPNPKGSQINHATIVVVVVDSLTIKIRFLNTLLRSQIAHRSYHWVLHSRTTVARPAVSLVVWSHDK